jgi:hypothetical protein
MQRNEMRLAGTLMELSGMRSIGVIAVKPEVHDFTI